MTVWWVRSNDWLGGTLDRNNLAASINRGDWTLPTGATSTEASAIRMTRQAHSPNYDERDIYKACQVARPLTLKDTRLRPWLMRVLTPETRQSQLFSPYDIERSVARIHRTG
jgi:hypothetical protein